MLANELTTKAPTKWGLHPIAEVAIPSPLYRNFDYAIPDNVINHIQPGMRVKVPFGRRSIIGLILKTKTKTTIQQSKLRSIDDVLDEEPILPADLLEMIQWASQYYHYPIGEVFSSCLPTLLRQGKAPEQSTEYYWQLTSSGKIVDTDSLKRAPKQQQVLSILKQQTDGINASTLNTQMSRWQKPMQALVEKMLVEKYTQTKLSETAKNTINNICETKLELNAEQQIAIDAILDEANTHKTWLLDGITGSGKTEVYLNTIATLVQQNKQALILVPEIGLTPQLLDRFKQRFHTDICALHSGLTDRERLNAWLQAKNGTAQIIVGTRSAIFTPLKNPGIIIVDEEHDSSYKQQDNFRYHARDLAVWRAKKLGIPIVLGSATPSFESLNNARKQRYSTLQLTQRAGNAISPRIGVLDARQISSRKIFTPKLIESISNHLQQGGQVLLFLNRRGYSASVICNDCGWIAQCERCDAYMTLHKQEQKLRCHHCDSERRLFNECPNCNSDDIQPLGLGTERVEQALNEKFPNETIIRIDRDTTKRKGELENHLTAARQGHANILIGTQMLAKGHHFPNVTLVGILNIDQGLFSADFRGTEYMAQLITQVAGRAGRANKPGEVLIQTHQPFHPLLHALITQSYNVFASEALEERKMINLPPYAHTALLRAESVKPLDGSLFLKKIRDTLHTDRQVEWLGPIPAPMERRAGRYRSHLLIQSQNRNALHTTLKAIGPYAENSTLARRVRWSLDVDPIEMF